MYNYNIIPNCQLQPFTYTCVLAGESPDLEQVEGEATSPSLNEVKSLEKMFDNLLDLTSEYLHKKEIEIHKIRRSLYVRHMSDTQTDSDYVAGHRQEIKETETVYDVFEILSANKCWDFLNPGLLNRIIEDHCCESQQIQDCRKEYMEKLQDFQKKTKVKRFAMVCHVPAYKFYEVVHKTQMDRKMDWDNATLEDMENWKQVMQGHTFFHNHMHAQVPRRKITRIPP